MERKPLLLADGSLMGMAQEVDFPVAVVAMEKRIEPNYQLPPMAELLNLEQALNGLREGRFSSLLMSPRRSPFWDIQRPLISRTWEMRKKVRNDSMLRQYQIPRLALSRGIPLNVVDTTDTFHIAEWDHPLLHAAQTYWIRELPIHPFHILINTSRRFRRLSILDLSPLMKDLKKIRSISLGLWDSRQKLATPAPKRHDIFFSGSDSSPLREEVRRTLRRLRDEGKYRVYLPEKTLPLEEFYQACAEAYVVVSPAGYGWDCYRHYETALCGSVPVMNYPTIRRYHPFIEGEHGLYYDLEENGLERCLEKALADRPGLIEMGQRARSHVLQYHLFSKLLRMMLEPSPEIKVNEA